MSKYVFFQDLKTHIKAENIQISKDGNTATLKFQVGNIYFLVRPARFLSILQKPRSNFVNFLMKSTGTNIIMRVEIEPYAEISKKSIPTRNKSQSTKVTFSGLQEDETYKVKIKTILNSVNVCSVDKKLP